MNILYNGIFCEDIVFDEILKSTKGNMPFAQQKFEKNLLEGFNSIENDINITKITTLPVLRYPKYKQIIFRKKISKDNHIYLGFINLPILKQISIVFSQIKEIILWNKNCEKNEDKVMLIYATNPINTIPALLLRRIFKFNVYTIVSEIDSFRVFTQKGLISKLKSKLLVSMSKLLGNSFDGYILISKYMNEVINKKNKKYIVVEGIVNQNDLDIIKLDYNNKEKFIMYAGSLHEKYGIGKLVKAFELLENVDYKLVIFGDGDFKNELEKICQCNTNIIYKGIVSNNKILEYEKKASLLINPRPSNEILTRYSFPSKTLEYMLSGTACLITRLKGIPNEYFEFCYTFDDETIFGISEKIKEVMKKSNEELEKKAISAQLFVTKNKNANAQALKIYNFLKTDRLN